MLKDFPEVSRQHDESSGILTPRSDEVESGSNDKVHVMKGITVFRIHE